MSPNSNRKNTPLDLESEEMKGGVRVVNSDVGYSGNLGNTAGIQGVEMQEGPLRLPIDSNQPPPTAKPEKPISKAAQRAAEIKAKKAAEKG